MMQLRARVGAGSTATPSQVSEHLAGLSKAVVWGCTGAGGRLAWGVLAAAVLAGPACAETPLTVDAAAHLAARNAPSVNTGTLLAFAFHESRLHSLAVHDNTTGRTALPATPADATALASSLLAQGHSLDLGIMQVNSANLARTGLTVASAFNAAASMGAGGAILVDAYRQCLHGNRAAVHAEQQAALRCAASVYNTGRETAGVTNGYQGRVWHVAAQIVPAIELAGLGAASGPAAPEGAAAPEPRRPYPRMEDALHVTAPVPADDDGMGDALHPHRKDTSK